MNIFKQKVIARRGRKKTEYRTSADGMIMFESGRSDS